MVKMEDNTQNKDCRLCLLRDLADRDAQNLYQYVIKAQNMLTESEKICIIMNRQLAGIDFIPDSSSPYGYSCLEVNAIPQLTSGYDVTTKMKKLSESIEE